MPTEHFLIDRIRLVPLKPYAASIKIKVLAVVDSLLFGLTPDLVPSCPLLLPGILGYTDRIRTGRSLPRLAAQESARNLTPAACMEMFLLTLSPLH